MTYCAFCSFIGRVHTATGAVHIAVRRAVPVRAGHRVPGHHRDVRPVARTGVRPFPLHPVEGHRAGGHRGAGPGVGHVHQLAGHRQVVPVGTPHCLAPANPVAASTA